ncbi:MAG: ABC transporter ATP-binding protein [Spirochaetota bacterium]
MALLELQDVTKRYTSRFSAVEKLALDSFSVSLEAGEFTGVMGPSGAGKTTLLNLIATIDSASSGSLKFDGREIAGLGANGLAEFRRDNLGFIFQDHNLLDTLTVRENIMLPLALQRRADRTRYSQQQIAERVTELARLLGIEETLDKYPVENSGGQRQRVAVARALAGNPGLILADEPTGSLDSVNARQLMQALESLNEHHAATILLVTHDPLVASYCKRIIFIRDGRLFTEVRKSGDRERFYREIVDVLAVLEGAQLEGVRS